MIKCLKYFDSFLAICRRLKLLSFLVFTIIYLIAYIWHIFYQGVKKLENVMQLMQGFSKSFWVIKSLVFGTRLSLNVSWFFMLFLTSALLCVTGVQQLFHLDLVVYIILLYLDGSISFIDYGCIGSCYFNAT